MKSINLAMRLSHRRMSSAGDFTADRAYELIEEATGTDRETARWLFAFMRVLNYITEAPFGGFRAAERHTWN